MAYKGKKFGISSRNSLRITIVHVLPVSLFIQKGGRESMFLSFHLRFEDGALCFHGRNILTIED